ncbi:MAG: methionine--tRNA ligase [Parcubacteria group bacterium]|nr:methionine--tRNA ligase [Parcubacteria group bacterium]
MKRPFFISTSIPYVNAAPHVGFAMEAVQADIIARYRRLKGDDVFLLSGTDENALKNVLKAEEEGEEVSTYVARHAALFKALLEQLNISNDDFIRTAAEERHRLGAQKLWHELNPDDIYKKSYEGLYCVGCEEFKTEKDLVDGECPEHRGKKLEHVAEENYFFRLTNYQRQLAGLFESGQIHVIPESRKNEVVTFLREGLQDISISRSRERARNWGIAVPDDDTQVMYVWIDALSNYINALGFAEESELYKTYWGAQGGVRLHVVGKGITRFHAIYWPALLLSANVPLPTHVFVHGYITSGGQKMSKTLGNVIDPVAIINEYGADAFRYFIARELSTFEDGDFTTERFAEAYNANLVNGLGNLTARVMKLAETHLEPGVRSDSSLLPSEYTDALDKYNIHAAVSYVWSRVQALDKKITDTKPFSVVKENPEEGKRLIAEAVVELYAIARLLKPFLPGTSEKIQTAVVENKMPESLFPRKA